MLKLPQRAMALLLTECLLLMCTRTGYAYQTDAPASGLPQAAQQSSEQLQQLVAPIALYPDALVAQILAAATYPDQIVDAGKWMEKHQDLTGEKLASEVDKQSWDVSVKALTQFPAVLANMNRNLAWTSELGDAYVNQQQELSTAVQTMRQRAKQAGNLNSTPQQTVGMQDENITIEPAEPDMVYVPQYDPWLAYGAPLAVFPGWYSTPGLFLAGPGIGFGLGFGVGVFAGYGWGWGGWRYDWHGGAFFHHSPYFSHSRAIFDRHSDFRGRGFNGGPHGFAHSHNARSHSGAFSGFNHGGVTHGYSQRGRSSFGGGGFHGGWGGFHGGGRR